MVGQTLDEHLLEQSLGKGSYGEVFKATQISTGDSVALKIASLPFRDPLDEVRFGQENTILHQLKIHPKIVEPKSTVIAVPPNITYYTMELADTDLDKYIAANYQLTLSEKISIFKDICAGLQHAHSLNIVHRDLHWGNVLIKLNSTADIKLTDFGKAKDFSSRNISSNEPCWGEFVKPPEVIFKVKENPVVEDYILGDMYALGILLYFLLVGVPELEIASIRIRIDGIKRTVAFDTLVEAERSSLYQTWLNTVPQSLKYLNVQFSDQVQTDQINELMKHLCNVDTSARFQNVQELRDYLDLVKI